MNRIFFTGAALLLALIPFSLPASDISSFTVEQYQYRDSATPSNVGALVLDNTGAAGFVNVWDSTGTQWLVRNLPVMSLSTTGPDGNISAMFDLGALGGSALRIDYSSGGAVDDSLGLNSSYVTGNSFLHSVTPTVTDFAVGGVGDLNPGGGPLQPSYAGLSFNILGKTAIGNTADSAYQFGHQNVQAAQNQCAPAAVANSLQWLEDQYKIKVPNDNVPGLKGDNSLVGTLDTDMNRNVTNRAQGSGVWPLDGKLKYLDDNNLGQLSVKFQAGTGVDGFGTSPFNGGAALSGNADYTAHNVTAKAQSPKGGGVTFDWILGELQHGEDVELDISFQCGTDATGKAVYCRHYVEVTGAGYILGNPYITHLSDHVQSDKDPTDTKGTNQIDFDYVKLDRNGVITSLPGWGTATIDQAISESVPEPATWALLAGSLALLAGLRRRAGHAGGV